MTGEQIKRRYHPDGSPLYDISLDGCRVGLVRQFPGVRGWWSFGLFEREPINETAHRTRADAIALLVGRRLASIAGRVNHAAPTPSSPGGEA